MSLDISFTNFLGEWEDRDGNNGDTGNKFNDGAKINISIDGTWSGGDGQPKGTAWWNGRNEVNLIVQGNEETNNFTKLIDGVLYVESSEDNQKYILQRPDPVPT